MGAGGLPLPPIQRLQAQFAARQRQGQRAEVVQAEAEVGGAEGSPGRPLDIQASLNQLVGMLQRVLDFIPAGGDDSDGYDSTSTSDREHHS